MFALALFVKGGVKKNMKLIDTLILILILLILLVFTETTHACERINAGYVSYHFERANLRAAYFDYEQNRWVERKWNENNVGVGCEINGYGIQQYENSYFNTSINLYYYKKLFNREITDSFNINFGPQFGVVDGYTDSFFPYVVPRMDINFMSLTLTTILLGDRAVAFSLQANIWR